MIFNLYFLVFVGYRERKLLGRQRLKQQFLGGQQPVSLQEHKRGSNMMAKCWSVLLSFRASPSRGGSTQEAYCSSGLGVSRGDMNEKLSKVPVEIRQARGMKAKGFLENVLFPLIDSEELDKLGKEEQLRRLEDNLVVYKELNPGPGDDFTLVHVLGEVFDPVLLENPRAIQKTGQSIAGIERSQKVFTLLLEAVQCT